MVSGGLIAAFILHIKDKKEQDRLREELNTYQEAIKKQNRIFREMESLKEEFKKVKNAYKDLKERYDLLQKINEELMQYIRKLEADLKTGGVVTA